MALLQIIVSSAVGVRSFAAPWELYFATANELNDPLRLHHISVFQALLQMSWQRLSCGHFENSYAPKAGLDEEQIAAREMGPLMKFYLEHFCRV